MAIFHRGNRQALDALVEEYTTQSTLSRRAFLQRATAAGLSVSAASALLAACGGAPVGGAGASSTPSTVTSIDALTEYGSSELASFKEINKAFTNQTGIKVNVESTPDLP